MVKTQIKELENIEEINEAFSLADFEYSTIDFEKKVSAFKEAYFSERKELGFALQPLNYWNILLSYFYRYLNQNYKLQNKIKIIQQNFNFKDFFPTLGDLFKTDHQEYIKSDTGAELIILRLPKKTRVEKESLTEEIEKGFKGHLAFIWKDNYLTGLNLGYYDTYRIKNLLTRKEIQWKKENKEISYEDFKDIFFNKIHLNKDLYVKEINFSHSPLGSAFMQKVFSDNFNEDAIYYIKNFIESKEDSEVFNFFDPNHLEDLKISYKGGMDVKIKFKKNNFLEIEPYISSKNNDFALQRLLSEYGLSFGGNMRIIPTGKEKDYFLTSFLNLIISERCYNSKFLSKSPYKELIRKFNKLFVSGVREEQIKLCLNCMEKSFRGEVCPECKSSDKLKVIKKVNLFSLDKNKIIEYLSDYYSKEGYSVSKKGRTMRVFNESIILHEVKKEKEVFYLYISHSIIRNNLWRCLKNSTLPILIIDLRNQQILEGISSIKLGDLAYNLIAKRDEEIKKMIFPSSNEIWKQLKNRVYLNNISYMKEYLRGHQNLHELAFEDICFNLLRPIFHIISLSGGNKKVPDGAFRSATKKDFFVIYDCKRYPNGNIYSKIINFEKTGEKDKHILYMEQFLKNKFLNNRKNKFFLFIGVNESKDSFQRVLEKLNQEINRLNRSEKIGVLCINADSIIKIAEGFNNKEKPFNLEKFSLNFNNLLKKSTGFIEFAQIESIVNSSYSKRKIGSKNDFTVPN